MKTLQEVRSGWEKKSELIAEATLDSGTVLVVTKHNPSSYDLLRYFQMAGGWEVSCDYRGHSPEELITKLLTLVNL